MKCLIIDHQDSFTYNLVEIVQRLIGQENVIVVNDKGVRKQTSSYDSNITNATTQKTSYLTDLSLFTHIILSPGPGHPKNIGSFTQKVLDFCWKSNRPSLLGVCLGHQAIALRGGCQVEKTLPSHGQIDTVAISPSSLFQGLPKSFDIVRYHSLAVTQPNETFRVTATSADVIMGLEHATLPIYGLQFHPESILTQFGPKIMANFFGITSPLLPISFLPQPAPSMLKPQYLRVLPDLEKYTCKQIFETLVFSPGKPSCWIENSTFTLFAGGKLGEGKSIHVADFKITQGLGKILAIPFTAGFKSYEGVEDFLEFSSVIMKLKDAPWILLVSDISTTPSLESSSVDKDITPIQELTLTKSDPCFKDKIAETLQGPLLDGECYELCLTQQLLSTSILSQEIMEKLAIEAFAKSEKAQYSALYLNYTTGTLVSNSPETFCNVLSLGDSASVTVRPIKGTSSPAQVLGEKEKRENLMIVDLVRNDLNRVCIPGTVKCPRLFEIEDHGYCKQMVSTISGYLRSDVTISALVDSLFPAGSMTGAPKQRSMELIRSLETGPRGIYSGICGWWSANGKADLGVVIRSLEFAPESEGFKLRLGAGGAILIGSVIKDEIKEVWLKWSRSLKLLFNVIPRFEIDLGNERVLKKRTFNESSYLVETMRLAAQGNIWFLDWHLQRLSSSAKELWGLNCSVDTLRVDLENQVRKQFGWSVIEGSFFDESEESWKIRFILFHSGETRFESESLPVRASLNSLGLSLQGVFSWDPLLKLKLRCEKTAISNSLILFNEKGEITEGSWFNVAFLRDGLWVTPCLTCGLLPGLMRRHLLDKGLIKQGIVDVEDLVIGEKVMCFNSVRGVWYTNYECEAYKGA